MNSRAKIGTLAKTDPALLVPYGGEQRAIGELQALGVTLTPEDYRAIRESFGGGKRGRARARELVPLECPSCESRLTHYERSGREPYFAATVESSSHGPHCDVVQAASADAVAQVNHAPAISDVAPVSAVAVEEVTALSEAEETTYYFIPGAPEPSAGAQRLSRLGLGSTPSAAVEPTAPRGTELAHARELLIQGLHRALPTRCVVHYRGQDYVVVAAADLHTHVEGERVAVYGRLTESEWNAEAGRLTLKATQRSVQVWATAAAPRQLLQVESTARLEAPVLAKPMPFLAFGTLRRLGPTCGIPVIRGDSLVLLQALAAGFREPSAELSAAQDGLTTLPSADEVRDSEGRDSSEVRDGDVRDSELFEARDSELYELYDSEPDQLLHHASSWKLDAVGARGVAAPVDGLHAHQVDPQPVPFADASTDGLAPSPAGTSLAAPDLAARGEGPSSGRGALSTLRSFASSLRRSKSRGGPA